MFIFNFQFVFMTIYIFLFLSDIDINDATGYIVDAQYFQNLAISSADSVTSRRNLGMMFSAGVWSTFLNTSKIFLLIYIVFQTFSLFFLPV